MWGASRIHGELLMLGFEVAQSTVSKYMPRGRRPPSQSWKTFLYNHAHAIAAIDLCIVPTPTFERLFAFLVVGYGRRQLLWIEVTRHPTAEWLARQITEAFPWASAPAYLVRDNDRAYGHDHPGERDGNSRPTDQSWFTLAKWHSRTNDWHASPRMLGPYRCFGERHLRRVLCSYVAYYNQTRPHRSLRKDAPLRRAIQTDRRRGNSFNPRRAASPICPDMIFGKDTT